MAKGAPGDMSFAGGPQMAAAPPVDIPPPPPPPPPPQMQPPPMPPQAVPRSDGLVTIRAPNGAPMTVSAADAARFQGLINNLQSSGVKIDPTQTGGYNPRNIAGTNTPSQHSYGRAVDINWTDNPLGQSSRPTTGGAPFDPNNLVDSAGDRPGQTTIPPELARTVARNNGMAWGGDWRRPDPMHFQVGRGSSPPMDQRALTRYAGSQPNGGNALVTSPLVPPQVPAPASARAAQPGQGGVQVASTSPAVPQSVSPPPPRSVPATDPSRLYQGFPRTMPGRPPSDQLWANKNPTQRYDTVQKLFNLPPQPPDGMDHYSYTGQVPPGSQIPEPSAPPPPSPPMMGVAGKTGAPEPWKPNWKAGLRMMGAVKPPSSQGLLPQAGIPPASLPPPRAPWQAARGMNRFKSAFPTA